MNVKYEVQLYVAVLWATGRIKRTKVRTVVVEEEATIFGSCRAIDAAIAIVGKDRCLLDVSPPRITPNPAELGWPLGEPTVMS